MLRDSSAFGWVPVPLISGLLPRLQIPLLAGTIRACVTRIDLTPTYDSQFDHSLSPWYVLTKAGEMETLAISKFKATCLAVMERVRRTGKPVLVTRFGEAVAEIVPPPPPARPDDWIGSMRSTGRIADDLVAPASEESDWDAFRP